jgi:hypothetical protein
MRFKKSIWGWGGTAGPDRLTWGGDHTFFGVGVAIGTQLSIEEASR